MFVVGFRQSLFFGSKCRLIHIDENIVVNYNLAATWDGFEVVREYIFKSNFEYDGFYIKLQTSSIIIDSIRSYADI